jgi:MFS family permease
MSVLERRSAILVFASFAFAYFFSALLRAITATLSPTLTQEFALSARDLGLLAGGYFLGFAAMQLSLGKWLDHHGPKKVILYFLSLAVMGCLLFSAANTFTSLLIARILCGAGVGACLMAPLTGYRRWLTPAALLRANSWMLMTGSLGMLASTLPVQWLMPVFGWRPLFWVLACGIALAMCVIVWQVPGWGAAQGATPVQSPGGYPAQGYGEVWRHAYFRRMVPLGFCTYGGMVAMQTLWAGPWMVRVSGYSPRGAAAGLFLINLCMLVTFWAWGAVNPWLLRKGFDTNRLITIGLPSNLLVLAGIVAFGSDAGAWAWALFCVSCTFVSLAQPAIGMAFPAALAGRALSAYNLVIFSGVFTIQWGVGLLVDGFSGAGLSEIDAYRAAMAVFLACSVSAYGYFLLAKSHNAPQQVLT